MARIRSIKPEYWTSEQVMGVSRDARLLFIGLWNFCDDGGNHPASAITLKAEVLPGDDVTAATVMQWVDELIEQQLLVEYEVDGREFWHVTGWHHQRIDQPTLRHPTGDTHGDAGDTGDARHHKRLGGKQRQLLLKKLREFRGDTCHQCGDAPGVTLARVTYVSPDEAQEYKGYGLVCASCKRKIGAGDALVTQGDARCLDGDSPTEGKGVEGSGGDLLNPTTTNVVVVDSVPATDLVLVHKAEDIEKSGKPSCPHKQIIALYHEILPLCPEIREWTPTRAEHLRARWSEDPKRQSLDYWRKFFAYVAESEFLTGRAYTQPGRKPFRADLEWICKLANFTKIREGKYHEGAAA